MNKFENYPNNLNNANESYSPEKLLSQETGITSTLLKKIKSDSKLLRAFKIIALSIGLIVGTESLAQEKNVNQHAENDKTEQLDQKDERLREIEDNHSLLQSNEYAVPQKILSTFARIVDPANHWGIQEPAGGYFDNNFLNKERAALFTKNLQSEGYSEKEISSFMEQLSGGNIVFSENTLANKDFKNILGHERLHKEIHHLPETEQKVLNEARDFIINDFKSKEAKWIGQQDSVYQNIFGDKKDISEEERVNLSKEYQNQSRRIIESYKPILLDKNGLGDDMNIATVISRPDEFYTYLLMDKFDLSVEQSLKTQFPAAYNIFNNLRNGILNDIENKSEK